MGVIEEPDHIADFIERVDRLEKRYKKAEYKYVDMYMMPREMMKAVRDELKTPSLFGREKDDGKR